MKADNKIQKCCFTKKKMQKTCSNEVGDKTPTYRLQEMCTLNSSKTYFVCVSQKFSG